ncbi:MAG TPA: erythromycin esterase family protein, partial [Gemmataceae bacterium]|nr:erythromycin esterase family protein [Gemmataceae bacterium]
EDQIAAVGDLSRPLRSPADLDPLLERIGEARCVLLGEASHGTHEYYNWRAQISERLIAEKGFSFIAVEGDWPDCYRANRFVKGYEGAGEGALEVLYAFERWPTWMWANEEVLALADWLHDYNWGLPEERRVGFYGLDVYSLWDSLYQVIGYLRKTDGRALEAAKGAVRCFEPYGEDPQRYARATMWVPESCEEEAVELLAEILRKVPAAAADGRDARFAAEQNSYVVKNAEAYYRAMVRGGPESWNIRDRHMADDGMVNVGQLVRHTYGTRNTVLVGFGSHRGSVIAGREWEAPMEVMHVPEAREDSWEDVLHRAGDNDRLLIFGGGAASKAIAEPRGHRAIGVVYHPETESYGNYVPTVLPKRYDAFVYLDRTRALHPLHLKSRHAGEVAETYPTGV